MKKIAVFFVALIAVIAVGIAVFFFACGEKGKPVTVKIVDSGNTLTVEGKDEMTVRKLLEKAKVGFTDNDEVYPPLDRRWCDVQGTTSIVVRKYAHVKLVYGDDVRETTLIGGTVELAMEDVGFDTEELAADVDKSTYLYDGMVITLKRAINGIAEEDGKTYLYIGGDRQTGGIVGNKQYGYYYADKDGAIDLDYCAPIEQNGKQYNVIKGRVTSVKTDSDKTMFNALKVVEKCTKPGMSKEEKLEKCFYYVKENYLEGVRHDPPYTEQDWPIIYADDILVYGKGDCFSYGAAFAYIGRALGCEESYACNSLGHGWAEVDGLVYDIEWSFHSDRDWIGISYDDSSEVRYANALNVGFEWKRMKITGSFSAYDENKEETDETSEDTYTEEEYSDDYSDDAYAEDEYTDEYADEYTDENYE